MDHTNKDSKVLVGHKEEGNKSKGEQMMQGRNTKPVLTIWTVRVKEE